MMKIKFTKMQGCGNDYIYVNCSEEKIPQHKKEGLVRRLSDRHFGIGGDGVIFIHSSPKLSEEEADFEMEMYNADGSRSEMCGNGIRCVAKYVYDKGLTDKASLQIVSCGKVKPLELTVEKEKVVEVKVNMGRPVLQTREIPVISERDEAIAEKIEVAGQTYRMTCVSMGNPHAVVFMEDAEALRTFNIEEVGSHFEHHSRFPQRTNVEFVKVLDANTIQMRVWERGTGETLACGTGACAAVVAGVLNGLTQEEVTVKLLGGELKICWDRETKLVYMTGPAETVFDGEIEVEDI